MNFFNRGQDIADFLYESVFANLYVFVTYPDDMGYTGVSWQGTVCYPAEGGFGLNSFGYARPYRTSISAYTTNDKRTGEV